MFRVKRSSAAPLISTAPRSAGAFFGVAEADIRRLQTYVSAT
jgi:hypothetical protein